MNPKSPTHNNKSIPRKELNPRNNKKGMTLIELMIATFIAAIILTVVLYMFMYARTLYEYDKYNFTIAEDSYIAISLLKKDLTMTSLPTVRVYPGDKDHQNEPPGVSMQSAVDSTTGQFRISDHGSPRWTKHVFYTLIEGKESEYLGKKIKLGKIMRWEEPLEPIADNFYNPVPFPSTLLPSAGTQKSKQDHNIKTILPNVLMPRQTPFGEHIEENKGFKITFVRRNPSTQKETLSTTNPSQINDLEGTPDKTSENTELIEVTITIIEISPINATPNTLELTFRVRPQNF